MENKTVSYCGHCHTRQPLVAQPRCPSCGAKLETITAPVLKTMKPTLHDIAAYNYWLSQHPKEVIR